MSSLHRLRIRPRARSHYSHAYASLRNEFELMSFNLKNRFLYCRVDSRSKAHDYALLLDVVSSLLSLLLLVAGMFLMLGMAMGLGNES